VLWGCLLKGQVWGQKYFARSLLRYRILPKSQRRMGRSCRCAGSIFVRCCGVVCVDDSNKLCLNDRVTNRSVPIAIDVETFLIFGEMPVCAFLYRHGSSRGLSQPTGGPHTRGADKSFTRRISRCILFDGESICFDGGLVIYINGTNIPPIMIINRIYEHKNLLSLSLVSFLVGLRTYQRPCKKNWRAAAW
jgi:hypothetical protein